MQHLWHSAVFIRCDILLNSFIQCVYKVYTQVTDGIWNYFLNSRWCTMHESYISCIESYPFFLMLYTYLTFEKKAYAPTTDDIFQCILLTKILKCHFNIIEMCSLSWVGCVIVTIIRSCLSQNMTRITVNNSSEIYIIVSLCRVSPVTTPRINDMWCEKCIFITAISCVSQWRIFQDDHLSPKSMVMTFDGQILWSWMIIARGYAAMPKIAWNKHILI